jgi:hypothetical protein
MINSELTEDPIEIMKILSKLEILGLGEEEKMKKY